MKNGTLLQPELDAAARYEAFRSVLRDAAEGHPSPRFLALTHMSPDPDALGALVGVRHLVQEGLGFPVEIATLGRIHRAENLAMVRELGLDFANYEDLRNEDYCGSILVDSQPQFGHTVVPEGIPLLAVFDHHVGPKSPEGDAKLESVAYLDVRESMGATASMVFEYLQAARVELDSLTATALFCGVRYDTGDLSHNVTPSDELAWYETFRHADRKIVARIDRPTLPAVYYRELSRSLNRARRYGSLVFCPLGNVFNPESVAEMADFLLRMESCRWSLVGGAYEGTYYISLRTRFGGGYAYPLLERVLAGEGSFGGHGRVAGGRIALGDDAEAALISLEERLRIRSVEILEEAGHLSPEDRAGEPLT